jgi:nitrate/nitrite-specific signal transduction histidine kinase
MRERAQRIGANLSIQSTPPEGTTVKLEFGRASQAQSGGVHVFT